MMMKGLSLLLVVFVGFSASQTDIPYVDRQCGGDINNLWLDIVFVVDNSKGMTDDGVAKVSADITSLFGESTRFGTDHPDPRTTRVAVVTYNEVASVAIDFGVINSVDNLFDSVYKALTGASSNGLSYVSTGIEAAEMVLDNGRKNGYRSNYKRVVVVYASSYEDDGDHDPRPTAQRLVQSGAYLITVAFNQDGNENLLNALGNIASPGMSFTSNDQDLVGEIQKAFIAANCFCPNLWKQYRAEFGNEASFKFGVCIQPSTIAASWRSAKYGCQNLHQSGHLVTEFDTVKHNFIYSYAKNLTAFQPPIAYHIGLHYTNGAWYWEQNKQVTLIQLEGDGQWNSGYPVTPLSSNAAVGNVQDGSDDKVGWQNYNEFSAPQYYFCETVSCDTETYCAA